ncbi:hypothetical protein [Variovorax paradoxus]|uniref:hypothetical protein n=1 Tax=Variovorax paradoxus TaxID=34073 RepID=UPI003D65A139
MPSIVVLLFTGIVVAAFYAGVLQAVSKSNWIWKVAPYLVSMVPVAIHIINYGFKIDTVFAIIFSIDDKVDRLLREERMI